MWGSIANLKENLNKIALDVHQDDEDDEDELEVYSRPNGVISPISDRRNSHSSAHSKLGSSSPLSNGMDDLAAFSSEIEQYKSEIKRLQASEGEIKALSVNYASLLKEKEDLIVRLNRENGSLKHNLEATKALSVSRNDSSASSSKGTDPVKGSSDQVSNRQHKFASHVKNRHAGSLKHNGVVSRKDSMNNGIISALDSDGIQNEMEPKHSDFQGNDKKVSELVDGRNGSTLAAQHTSEVRKLKTELEQERDKLGKIQLQFQAEVTLNKTLQEELKVSKLEIDKTSKEMSKIRDELNEKVSEIKRLQMELSRREDEDVGAGDSLKKLIKSLEKENVTLKVEKKELEVALETSKKSFTGKASADASQKDSSSMSEMPDSSKSFPEKEEMERSFQKLSKDLKETRRERDKALQQLTRLKQHLLEKESEDSQKMDEDSKIIEELRESNTFLRAQVSHLEKSLKQAIESHEELKMANSGEILKSREIIDDLNKKLANSTSIIDAKNTELLNLQTALGQYYAEIEAKEHLEEELAHAREESAKLSQQLRDADQRAEVLRGERDEILAKLSQSEKAQSEWRSRLSKLEEDNAKLRRVLEQSMTRLNRMSVDSDFLVDRRIVIKLLVTYFQRNHSKEVLDLMVRMLGFSDEDKQRIGVAQQGAGKGVVRGVLGLPGRLVGGILSGSPSEAAANVGSENQSFADMWVDFLLKETEEREKRDLTGNSCTGKPTDGSHQSPNTSAPPFSNQRMTTLSMNSSPTHNLSSPPHGYFPRSERLSSEFSTVPLSPSDSHTATSGTLPTRY